MLFNVSLITLEPEKKVCYVLFLLLLQGFTYGLYVPFVLVIRLQRWYVQNTKKLSAHSAANWYYLVPQVELIWFIFLMAAIS